MNDEQIGKIIKALANHLGLIQYANAYAVGSNEGGRYVSLFHDRLQFRVGTVYQERFKDLPAFIDTTDDGGEISTDRTRLAKQNLLKACPAFAFTRYQVGGDEDDKKAWRFGDVLWVSGNGNGNGKSETVTHLPEADPEPARVPVAESEPKPNRASAAQKQRIQTLARAYFGDNWDAATWCDRASHGSANTISALTPGQADRIIGGLEFLKVARECYGDKEADKVAAILGKASELDQAEYRLACDLPTGRSAEFVSKILAACGADVRGG